MCKYFIVYFLVEIGYLILEYTVFELSAVLKIHYFCGKFKNDGKTGRCFQKSGFPR